MKSTHETRPSRPSSRAAAAQVGWPQAQGQRLPAALQAKYETQSGTDLSAVRVQYGSPEPARHGALATAQGHQIHLSPGQEPQLSHELGHVVQQKAGRVPAQTHSPAGAPMNESPALEAEADAPPRYAGPGMHAARPVLQRRRLPDRKEVDYFLSQVKDPKVNKATQESLEQMIAWAIQELSPAELKAYQGRVATINPKESIASQLYYKVHHLHMVNSKLEHAMPTRGDNRLPKRGELDPIVKEAIRIAKQIHSNTANTAELTKVFGTHHPKARANYLGIANNLTSFNQVMVDKQGKVMEKTKHQIYLDRAGFLTEVSFGASSNPDAMNLPADKFTVKLDPKSKQYKNAVATLIHEAIHTLSPAYGKDVYPHEGGYRQTPYAQRVFIPSYYEELPKVLLQLQSNIPDLSPIAKPSPKGPQNPAITSATAYLRDASRELYNIHDHFADISDRVYQAVPELTQYLNIVAKWAKPLNLPFAKVMPSNYGLQHYSEAEKNPRKRPQLIPSKFDVAMVEGMVRILAMGTYFYNAAATNSSATIAQAIAAHKKEQKNKKAALTDSFYIGAYLRYRKGLTGKPKQDVPLVKKLAQSNRNKK